MTTKKEQDLDRKIEDFLGDSSTWKKSIAAHERFNDKRNAQQPPITHNTQPSENSWANSGHIKPKSPTTVKTR